MSDRSKQIKNMLKMSTTMPMGTGLAGGSADSPHLMGNHQGHHHHGHDHEHKTDGSCCGHDHGNDE